MGKVVYEFEPLMPGEKFEESAAEKFAASGPTEGPDWSKFALNVGLPAASMAINPSSLLVAGGLAAAGSLAEGQLEEGLHVPSAGEVGEAALSGAVSYAGGKVLAPLLALGGKAVKWPVNWVASRVMVPKDFYTDVENRQARNLYTWLKQLGSSPTPGQVLEGDVPKFVDTVARAGMFGRKPVEMLDKKNKRLMTDHIKEYVTTNANVAWQPNVFDHNGDVVKLARDRFGQVSRGILEGKIGMAQAANMANFDKFREGIAGKGLAVDVSKLVEKIDEHATNPFMQDVAAGIKQWITPVEGSTVVPAENAYEAVRQLNSYFGKSGKSGEKWAAGELKDVLKKDFEAGIGQVPEALAAYKEANKVFGKFASKLDNDVVEHLRSVFNKTPSAALQTVMSGGDKKYDTLMRIKEAYRTTSSGGRGALTQYQENIVEPLRYHVLQKSFDAETGLMSGKKLMSSLDKLGDDMGAEVFGKDGYKGMTEFAQALTRLDRSPVSANAKMWVTMAQGGLMAGGAFGTLASDETWPKVMALGIFMTPIVFARYVAGNPKLTKAMIDGMEAGVKSEKFHKVTAQLIALQGKETVMSEGQKEIYTNPSVHDITDENEKPDDTEVSLQFVPEDMLRKQMISAPGMR